MKMSSLGSRRGSATGSPSLPRSTDASTTARYIQSVVSGEKPAPGPLLQQVATLRRTLAAMHALPLNEASA